MKACNYAKKYRGIRRPTCGCDACANKYARRIARRIWSRLDMIGSSGDDATHTVLRVLREAKVLRHRTKPYALAGPSGNAQWSPYEAGGQRTKSIKG